MTITTTKRKKEMEFKEKICNICSFPYTPTNGRQKYCPRDRILVIKNRDKLTKREWRLKNPELNKKRKKESRDRNIEAYRSYMRKYRMRQINKCDHDFKNLKRMGRADYRCPRCGKNVMMLLVLAKDAGIDLTE